MAVEFRPTANTLLTAPFNEAETPRLLADDYRSRIRRLWQAAGDRYTHIVVYADREHYSNMEYLTGFDPRFEEALLILSRDSDLPVVVAGYEGMEYATAISLLVKRVLYTPFGLVGQVPGGVRLEQILGEAGILAGDRVGLAGWKYFSPADVEVPERRFEVPHYLVAALADLVGLENIANVGALFMDNVTGLRHSLEAKELVLLEMAGTKSSRATHRVMAGLREGMTEIEAASLLGIDGTPLGTHPNVNFGWDNVVVGLASPTPHSTLHRAEPCGMGVGYRRSLCHRAGVYAASEAELEPERQGCLDAFYRPYFHAVAAWYEALAIGVSGGEVYDAVIRVLGSLEAFGIGLNPGHLIHTDEWSNSPFSAGNRDALPNGVGIQCDFTAVSRTYRLTAHAEDGVILADAALQKEIAKVSPASLSRMLARREFMRSRLGIAVGDDVLPTSDMPAWFTPFMAEPDTVLVKR